MAQTPHIDFFDVSTPITPPGRIDFSGVSTPLSDDERKFRDWYGGLVKRRNTMGMPLNPDPDDPAHQYDNRALFKSGWTAPPNWETPEGGGGHFPSRYKTDANPRAIVNGMNTKTGQKVAPDWYTGPKENAPPPPPSPLEQAARGFFGFVSQPYAGPPQTDILAAASRGLLHGTTQPFSSPELAPFLQKPPQERGLASKVEDVSDIIGQFLPVNIALKGVRIGMEAVGLARRLAPFWGTIVENAGAGGLFRIAQAISDNPDGFARMKRKDAALYLAQQAGLGMAQWGAFAGLIEGGTGLVQAALLNSTLRPSAESIWRQINQRGWDHQVDAELKAAGTDPEQIKAALARFWPLLSVNKQVELAKAHPNEAPTDFYQRFPEFAPKPPEPPPPPPPPPRFPVSPGGYVPGPETYPRTFPEPTRQPRPFPATPGGFTPQPTVSPEPEWLRPPAPWSPLVWSMGKPVQEARPEAPAVPSLLPRPAVPGGLTPWVPGSRPETAPLLRAPIFPTAVPGGMTRVSPWPVPEHRYGEVPAPEGPPITWWQGKPVQETPRPEAAPAPPTPPAALTSPTVPERVVQMSAEQQKHAAAQKYIRKIRNDAKRKYAAAYFRAMVTGGPKPADPKDLSYMAAQSVRMELADILGAATEEAKPEVTPPAPSTAPASREIPAPAAGGFRGRVTEEQAARLETEQAARVKAEFERLNKIGAKVFQSEDGNRRVIVYPSGRAAFQAKYVTSLGPNSHGFMRQFGSVADATKYAEAWAKGASEEELKALEGTSPVPAAPPPTPAAPSQPEVAAPPAPEIPPAPPPTAPVSGAAEEKFQRVQQAAMASGTNEYNANLRAIAQAAGMEPTNENASLVADLWRGPGVIDGHRLMALAEFVKGARATLGAWVKQATEQFDPRLPSEGYRGAWYGFAPAEPSADVIKSETESYVKAKTSLRRGSKAFEEALKVYAPQAEFDHLARVIEKNEANIKNLQNDAPKRPPAKETDWDRRAKMLAAIDGESEETVAARKFGERVQKEERDIYEQYQSRIRENKRIIDEAKTRQEALGDASPKIPMVPFAESKLIASGSAKRAFGTSTVRLVTEDGGWWGDGGAMMRGTPPADFLALGIDASKKPRMGVLLKSLTKDAKAPVDLVAVDDGRVGGINPYVVGWVGEGKAREPIFLKADYIALARKIHGPDIEWRGSGSLKPILGYKGGEPVAAISPLRIDKGEPIAQAGMRVLTGKAKAVSGGERGAIGLWIVPGKGKYAGATGAESMTLAEGAAEAEARPIVQQLHALATLQREGYLQDLKDVAQEVPGARYPHEAEGNAVKAPDALLDKIVARGKTDITDALRMTLVVRKLEDAPAIRRALESRGYQIVEWLERRPFRDIAIKLKNGADDQLTKELLLKTPRVFELAQTLGHDIYEITDKILPRLVKTEGDTPLTRKIGTLLERAMARIYRPAYALDSEMTPAISTAAESSGGVSIPALTKSDVTALQGLSNSLREPASNISDSVLSRRLELADAVDRFVATHAPPSAPIVPQPIPEAAQEFVQPAAGGPPQPPGGSPPVAPPPTGGEGPPPGEEGLPRASTLAEVAEVARQRGPTPVPGTPGYEIPPGISPHLPAAPPWQAQVRQSLKNMIGGFARIAMLDPRRWIAPGDQPGVNQAARRVAFGALGQRDFDAAMIFREWQERIAPIIRQLASRATDVDESGKPLSAANKERLLAEALAWHLDSRRNPAEVAAYVQDALRQAQASDDEVLKRLPAIVHRASRLSDEELALAGEMDAFDQVRGRLRQDTDVQEGILEFHVSHIWKALKSGAKPTPAAGLSERLRASSPFAQGRLISTFARGIAEGHAPQTLDIRLINQIENMDTAHVLMSRQIVKGLEDANVGRWMEPRDAPAGWRSLGDTPMFKKGTQRMFVPEDAYPVLRPFVEKGTPPIHPDLQKLQFFVKRMELSLSLFHDFHLVGMFALSHPVTFLETLPKSVFNLAENISRGNFDIYGSWEPVRRGLEYATHPTEVMEMFWRGGGTDSSTKMIDAYHDLLSPEKRTFFEQFQQYRDRSLWDKLWRGLKAYEAVEEGQRLLKTMQDSPNPRTGAKYTPQEIMEGVAAHYNKKYGGLNWDRMGTAQQTRLNMRALLFAPDWLLSNTMFTVDGFKGILDLRAGRDTVQSRLAVKDLTTLAVTWMTLTQAASLMMTGHTTWDNEPGHEFQLEIPQRGPRAQRQYLDVTTPAAFLTFAHLLAGGMAGARTGTGLGEQTVFTRADAAGKGLADRVKSLLAARLAYLPRVAQNYLSNASFGGRPLLPGSTLSERAATGAKNVVFQALPFTVQAGLRASPVGQYIPGGLPGGQISLTEAATQFAGVGTPSIGAVVDKITFDRGLTRLNKADFFRNLSDPERLEFLQQFRTGQFTGPIAQKIRAAANRQQALQSSASQRETQMLERGQIQEAIRSMAQRGVSLPTIRTRILPFLLRNLGEGDKRLQQATP